MGAILWVGTAEMVCTDLRLFDEQSVHQQEHKSLFPSTANPPMCFIYYIMNYSQEYEAVRVSLLCVCVCVFVWCVLVYVCVDGHSLVC